MAGSCTSFSSWKAAKEFASNGQGSSGGGILKIGNWVCFETKANSEDITKGMVSALPGVLRSAVREAGLGLPGGAQLGTAVPVGWAGVQPGACQGEGEELHSHYQAFSEGKARSLQQTLKRLRASLVPGRPGQKSPVPVLGPRALCRAAGPPKVQKLQL